ncbi:hypothetical protein IMZ48_20300 [Candidatus Bathyarchaeota archaeon]|nr:hypothetical protein [Candidatus Bathyarchaeota archaeon]
MDRFSTSGEFKEAAAAAAAAAAFFARPALFVRAIFRWLGEEVVAGGCVRWVLKGEGAEKEDGRKRVLLP